MDKGVKQMSIQVHQGLLVPQNNNRKHEDKWMNMQGDYNDDDDMSNISSSSSFDNSSTTNGSTSSISSDVADDASSPTSTLTSSSSSNSTSPLFQFSDLMAHLPIKRGLSKFYQGKSQSFTSLSRVESIEDLPKKETPYRRKILKASKSYGNGLDGYKPYTLPKAIISKKASSRSSCLSNFPGRSSSSSFLNSRPPLAPPIQKKF